MKLSVLQWNVLYEEKAANILKFIREMNADVVCLQELTQDSTANPEIDIPRKIKELGYEQFYEPASKDPGFILGNGIFSKYPIKRRSISATQRGDGSGDYDKVTRLYLEVLLDIGGRSLYVGTAHLSYTDRFKQTPRREIENQKFLSYVNEHQHNFVFCGDFNANPDSALIQGLDRKFKTACPPFNEPTWTTKPFSYQGFEADTLNWRLDYMFVTKDIKVVNTKIIRTDFSDHLPILTAIEI
jgi:endonuclease/exonuclease/phosphatase family metal-dependent hydrolase